MKKIINILFFLAGSWLLMACSSQVESLVVGRDHCDFCKMTYNDNRFGAELITAKGKIYKFDDVHCLVGFIRENDSRLKEAYALYFVDFKGSHAWVTADKAHFLKSETLRSPMNSNVAVFDHVDSLQLTAKQYPGVTLSWNKILQL